MPDLTPDQLARFTEAEGDRPETVLALLAERDRLRDENRWLRAEADELRWLVGHLANAAPDEVKLPPRLAPLVRECAATHDPARYTLADVLRAAPHRPHPHKGHPR